jgi:DNA-binding response OmpR family regulator
MVSGSRPRVLVIDDDAGVREMLCQVLEAAGYAAVGAADGAEALAAFSTHPADLVLTDILMPRKDGIQTIAELRARCPALRVIAMTAARGRFNRLAAARYLGVQDTLIKPFPVGELLAAVRHALAP